METSCTGILIAVYHWGVPVTTTRASYIITLLLPCDKTNKNRATQVKN